MKVLITGAAGFIGSHLTDKLLAAGVEVCGIDNFDDFYAREMKMRNIADARKNDRFHFIEMDITDPAAFKVLNNQQFSVIYHLAAKAGVRPSIQWPEKYISNNITGTLNMLEYMRASGNTKLVFASSSSIYGNSRIIPFSEDAAVDEPISPYAFTKKSCELLTYNYHHLYQLDIINLRFFTVYGPRQRPDLAIHKFLNEIKAGKPIEIFGDGSTARDYTFVNDTISGVIKAGEYIKAGTGIYEIVNLGNNTPVKLIDLVNTYKKVLGQDFATVHKGMQQGDVDITFANIEKAKRLLGYDPQTTLEEGLTAFIQWHNEINK